MVKRCIQWGSMVILGLTTSCAQPPQPQASPEQPSTITAPINKTEQKAHDIQEKAKQREQLNPEATPQPTVSP